MYQIKYQPQAVKYLHKLDNVTKKRILTYLEKVAKNPESHGKPLTADKKGYWRYRVGEYRIICSIIKKELVVLVVDIGNRSNVYK